MPKEWTARQGAGGTAGAGARSSEGEADEMAALDAVRDYEADPNVMLEDVPQDIVIKTLKVSCACVPVLVFVCVCVCACAQRRYVFVRICICIF